MALIPQATNGNYRGSPFAWWFLLLVGALNLEVCKFARLSEGSQ